MISYTLENVLILNVFQLLISGLILCASGALLYQREIAADRDALKYLVSAFSLYSFHLLILSVLSYQGLSLPEPLDPPAGWQLLLRITESSAVVLLGIMHLLQLFPSRRRSLLWIAAGMLGTLVISDLVATLATPAASAQRYSDLLQGGWLLGTATLHLRLHSLRGLLAAIALSLLGAAQLLRGAPLQPQEAAALWGLENAILSAAFVLFAILVDTRSEYLPVRFFLRLNLIFVILATLLILMDAQLQRREHIGIAESQTVELSEFLRAHVLQFHDLGWDPKDVLGHEEIIRKITSDFGRLPDLRRVRVFLSGWILEMSIGPDWVVNQKVFQETDLRPPEPWNASNWGRVGTLTPVPILSRGRQLGRIELDEFLGTVNEQVTRHIRLVFLTFTVAVFVAAALFGFTVHRAHSTIQRQFRELDKTHLHMAHVERLAAVGQMAGGVAHEINNPAGIILTTADFIMRESEKQGLSESFREDVQVIRRQARRISEVVSGLLTFSRPAVLNKQPADINRIIGQSMVLLAPRFRDLGVIVEQQLTPGLPAICVDANRLEQVFVNLLNNAADAVQKGGCVRAGTSLQESNGSATVVVSVTDNGSGISPEHLQKIFDPFFSTKPRGRGTGLGLSVSHGIIRDHGGRIEVQSQVGSGTVFHVHLPVTEARREVV